MIVLSLIFVLVAAGTLIAGFLRPEELTLIYVSIGAAVAAIVFLVLAVLQRRRSVASSATSRSAGATRPVTRSASRPAEERTTVPRGAATSDEPKDRFFRLDPEEAAPSEQPTPAAHPAPAEEPEHAAPPPYEDTAPPPTAPAEWEPEPEREPEPAPEPEPAWKGSETADLSPAGAAERHHEEVAAEPAVEEPVEEPETPEPAHAAPADQPEAPPVTFDHHSDELTGGLTGTTLPDVDGLRPMARVSLLARFGSVAAIRDASVAELTEIDGIDAALAEELKRRLV